MATEPSPGAASEAEAVPEAADNELESAPSDLESTPCDRDESAVGRDSETRPGGGLPDQLETKVQPGALAQSPPSQTPTWRRRLAAIVTALAAAGAFVGDIGGLQGVACSLPGLSYVCGEIGLGGVPSAAERELWNSRGPESCSTYREYLQRFPDGPLAEASDRALGARTFRDQVTWIDDRRNLPLTTRRGIDPFPTEAAAQEDALARGQIDAQRLICGGFEGGEYRLISARAEQEVWNCQQLQGGFVCGFDGRAICELKVRRVETFEVCP